MTIEIQTTPRIYIACLAAYNSGKLHGSWIDATQGMDCLQEEIQELLKKSPIPNAEEWAIHDHEGFGSCSITENGDLESICEKAEFIAEHGELGAEILSNFHGCLDDAQEAMEDNYHGEHDSELDYATELFDEIYLHDVPKFVQGYIDYESFCRDLFLDGHYSIRIGHKVHVFSNH